jgi:hypothetical protein
MSFNVLELHAAKMEDRRALQVPVGSRRLSCCPIQTLLPDGIQRYLRLCVSAFFFPMCSVLSMCPVLSLES